MKNVILKTRFRGGVLHALYNELIKNPPDNYRFTVSDASKKSPLTKITSKYDSYLYIKYRKQLDYRTIGRGG